MEEMQRSLDWNDEIVQENNFILFPEGEYEFVVESFERGRFEGSEKMSPCNMAILKIKLLNNSTGETTIVNHNLFLHQKTEWALSAFFASIGLKKKGEKLKMNWNLVTGARGWCQVTIEQYKGNDYNKIKKFIPSYEVNLKPAFTPGSF